MITLVSRDRFDYEIENQADGYDHLDKALLADLFDLLQGWFENKKSFITVNIEHIAACSSLLFLHLSTAIFNSL